MTICPYLISSTSPCGAEVATGSNYCAHHSTIRCVSCHEQATHNCQNTVANICGCPLCEDCEHVPDAANGQFYSHAGKGMEPIIPHYAPPELHEKK